MLSHILEYWQSVTDLICITLFHSILVQIDRPGSLINKDELQVIEDFQFMPREVNKAKGMVPIVIFIEHSSATLWPWFKPRIDFDRIVEIEETPSKDQIMTEYLQHF